MYAVSYERVIRKTITYCLAVTLLLLMYIHVLLPIGVPIDIEMKAVRVEKYDEIGCVYSLKYPANLTYVDGWGNNQSTSISNPLIDPEDVDGKVVNLVIVTFKSFSNDKEKKWIVLSLS